jgi:hypothetical protein
MAASMESTKNKHQQFAITDINEIKELIVGNYYTLEQLVDQIVGRKHICGCYHCAADAYIQDTFNFLMYLYHNIPECKSDPVNYISEILKTWFVLLQPEKNPLFALRIRMITDACKISKNDEELTELLSTSVQIKDIDDAFVILKEKDYTLENAISVVFNTIYPNNTICDMCDLGRCKPALMYWILFVQGHVKKEMPFNDFIIPSDVCHT